MIRRRRMLVATLAAGLATGCVRISPRQSAGADLSSSPVTDDWQGSGQAMVADALATLRTFDIFQAYRVAVTPSSDLRTRSILAWDPPTGAAWDAATHVSRSLHDRANQLFLAITAASVDPAQWRLQRELADATHDLIELGDALQAYRDRIDALPPGDAAGALGLLDRAWAGWDAVALRFGTSRGELIGTGDNRSRPWSAGFITGDTP